MAYDILTTSGINSLISSYTTSESNKLVSPLNKSKTRYQNLSTAYSSLSSKLESLKTILSEFKLTGSSSIFSSKTASSSNTGFVSASATSAASASSFSIRVDQLAKNDIAISQDMTSSTSNAITGTHNFVIKTGDGSTGEFTSNVEVTFTASETNQTIMEKIRDAINQDKAVVTSSAKSASANYTGGTSSFIINLNGTETTVTVNGGGTYEALVDELVANINTNVSGVSAEKVLDSPSPGDVKVKLTVTDSSKYISIAHSSGFDLVSDLGISVTKEKGASGLVTASVFTPTSTTSQLSFTSKETGLDNRIKDLSNSGLSTALSAVGLNLGTSRPAFNQSLDPDTPGYMYSDITSTNNQLNAKFTFNGLNLQRNSNSISDLVTGSTITLKSVMQPTDTTVNIAISNDVTAIRSKIESFISKFNEAYSYIKSNSAVSSGERGFFVGDANAFSLTSAFNSFSFTPVSGLSAGDLNLLSQIGITFNPATGLQIGDSSLLNQKLSNNMPQVEALFNSTNGVANKLYSQINPYLGSSGYLALGKSAFDNNITYINDRIGAVQKRINRSADLLRQRYEQLQVQLASLLTSQSLFSSGNSFF